MERFALTLASSLPKDGFEVRIYALLRKNPWLGAFRERGIPVTIIGAENRPGLRSWPVNALALLRLAWHLRRDRIEVIHAPDFYPAAMARLASVLARVPGRVHTLHSVYDWYSPSVFRVQRLLGFFTDAVTAVSMPVLEYSRNREHQPDSKYRLIHNGADEQRFRPDLQARRRERVRLGWKEDDHVVGAVGARSPRKGHPLLAEGIAPLMKRDPKLRLAILGAASDRYPDTRSEVERIAISYGVLDRVHFLEPRDDVENFFAAIDVHCMPSEVEGLSFAAIEGILSGCVSVFSDLAAFRELVDHGTTGYLFERNDPTSLRQMLVQALAIPHWDKQFSVRSRSAAIERFGQSRMVDLYASLYQEILVGKGRLRPDPERKPLLVDARV
ncbi:MAG: glycosyltransferase [Fibrobacteres bacterium]|nr:glycosyltransferase [Fibrobacterota bacterium]